MEENKLITLILKNAQTINELRDKRMRALEKVDENRQAYYDACDTFESSYDNLAFPGGLEQALELLKHKDPSILPSAITYLKADPYCFRSGYTKKKIVHFLKRFDLTKNQTEELQDILINAIKNKEQFYITEYRKLALKINDSHLQAEIEKLINQSNDKIILRRAKVILDSLQNKK